MARVVLHLEQITRIKGPDTQGSFATAEVSVLSSGMIMTSGFSGGVAAWELPSSSDIVDWISSSSSLKLPESGFCKIKYKTLKM